MKHIMNVHRRWKAKLVGLRTNFLNYLERTEMFPVEFFGWTLGFDIRREKPNFVSNCKFDTFMLSVVVLCLEVLCIFEILDEVVMKVPKGVCQGFGRRHSE